MPISIAIRRCPPASEFIATTTTGREAAADGRVRAVRHVAGGIGAAAAARRAASGANTDGMALRAAALVRLAQRAAHYRARRGRLARKRSPQAAAASSALSRPGTAASSSSSSSSRSPPTDAVVLLSGGLDSATTLAIARSQGYRCHALSFDYGQRHRCELEAAKRVAASLGVHQHQWVQLDLRAFGGSALTSDSVAVPKRKEEAAVAAGDDSAAEPLPVPSVIPPTYVPARNTIFLSYALAYAEVNCAKDVFIGANAVDYSGYPDCRPAYFEAFQRLAQLATKAGVEAAAEQQARACTDRNHHHHHEDDQGALRLHTPLLTMRKEDIIREGRRLGVDYALTHSCYDPLDAAGAPCGECDSCRIRQRAFRRLGLVDPTIRAAPPSATTAATSSRAAAAAAASSGSGSGSGRRD